KMLAVLVADEPGHYRLAFSSPPGAPPRFYSQAPLSDFHTTGPATYIRFDRSGEFLGLSTNERSSRNEFWRIPVAGGPPQEMLGSTAPPPGRFTWLNAGTGIVQDTTVSYFRSHLLLFDLEAKTVREITAGGSRELQPALSPDGATLAFASGQFGYRIIEVA